MTTKKNEQPRPLASIDIKGKAYVTVNERLRYFREVHKDWSLITETIQLDESWVVMRATISDPKGRAIADGMAYEKAGSNYINKTSYIENCQTSAWGRALANLGIGIEESVASAEEVVNAVNNQPYTPTDSESQTFESYLRSSTIDDDKIDGVLASMNNGEWTKKQFEKNLQDAKDNQRPDDRVASKIGRKDTPSGYKAHAELQDKIDRDTYNETKK